MRDLLFRMPNGIDTRKQDYYVDKNRAKEFTLSLSPLYQPKCERLPKNRKAVTIIAAVCWV